MPSGKPIRSFIKAALDRDPSALGDATDELEVALGPGAVIDAAGTVAVFEAINRVADATGTQLDSVTEQLSASMLDDVDGWAALRSTAEVS